MSFISHCRKENVLVTILILMLCIITSRGAEKKTSFQFLHQVRHPAGRKTWSMLNGKISHRRRGQKSESATIYLGILFSREHTLAQIIVDNTQAYMIGQEYSTDNSSSTTIIPHNKSGYKKPILAEFGVKPEDLTMSFIYWKFLRELNEISIKTLNCRVFDLISPDKKETVRIYISSAYFFPMKVEWFKEKASTPYRTLQVSDFTKKNNIWIISRLKFHGPGWRSIIDFDKIDAGLTEKNIPAVIFKQLPEDK